MIDSLSPALQADDLVKIYDEGPARIEVLSNVSLSVARGEMVAIVGASGSGKSTLLHILGLLDVPTSGSVAVDGQLAVGLSEAKKSQVRNRSLGFVYQFHHLLPEFSALDNVAMPLIVRRENRDKARAAAREVLGLVGLAAREGHFPPAVGRRAPARGAGARAGDATGLRAGRRAHRQPRPPHRPQHVRAADPRQPRVGHGVCDRHPRSRAGGARRSPAADGKRPAGLGLRPARGPGGAMIEQETGARRPRPC
ncbi:ATP-binding cassette domain-containing protein [Achromobacter xylosoxidans]